MSVASKRTLGDREKKRRGKSNGQLGGERLSQRSAELKMTEMESPRPGTSYTTPQISKTVAEVAQQNRERDLDEIKARTMHNMVR